MVLIGHVSPSMKDAKETESTIRFAEAAGRMRPKVCANRLLLILLCFVAPSIAFNQFEVACSI